MNSTATQERLEKDETHSNDKGKEPNNAKNLKVTEGKDPIMTVDGLDVSKGKLLHNNGISKYVYKFLKYLQYSSI